MLAVAIAIYANRRYLAFAWCVRSRDFRSKSPVTSTNHVGRFYRMAFENGGQQRCLDRRDRRNTPLECPHQSTANSLAIKFPRDRRVLPYPNSQLANQKPKSVKLIGCQFNLRVNEN